MTINYLAFAIKYDDEDAAVRPGITATVVANASNVGHLKRSSRYADRPAPAIIANKGTCLVENISAGLSRGWLCFQGACVASLHIA